MAFVKVRCPHCDAENAINASLCAECGKPLANQRPPAAPPRGASMTTVLLGFVSAVAGIGGVLALSEATMGVGFIAFACLLAIWSRLSQAADYRDRP